SVRWVGSPTCPMTSRPGTTSTSIPQRAPVVRAAIDTGALLALASPRDQYHKDAVRIAKRFVARGGTWTGSVLVLAELHGHLLRWRGPGPAREVIGALLRDPAYDWRDAGVELLESAVSDW